MKSRPKPSTRRLVWALLAGLALMLLAVSFRASWSVGQLSQSDLYTKLQDNYIGVEVYYARDIGSPGRPLLFEEPVRVDTLSLGFRLEGETDRWLVEINPIISNKPGAARALVCRYVLPLGSIPYNFQLGTAASVAKFPDSNVEVFEGSCSQRGGRTKNARAWSPGATVLFALPQQMKETVGTGLTEISFTPVKDVMDVPFRGAEYDKSGESLGVLGPPAKYLDYSIITDSAVDDFRVPSSHEVLRFEQHYVEAAVRSEKEAEFGAGSGFSEGAVSITLRRDRAILFWQASMAVGGFLLGFFVDRLFSSSRASPGRQEPRSAIDSLLLDDLK